MFPLTRPIRQTVATIALLVLTVVPTGVVATIAWRINQPGHVRDVEVELGRQLGLQVTLSAVRYPKPGELIYQGITLRQEEPRSKGLTRNRPGRSGPIATRGSRTHSPSRKPAFVRG